LSPVDPERQEDGGRGPVGRGNYVVRQGDCVQSIATERGLRWETIWNHPRNGDLRAARKDPNVLLPGDRLFVPDIQLKQEQGQTEQRHRFKKKGTPGKLRIRVLDENHRPRANVPYTLSIDGRLFSGHLDGEGFLEVVIPPDARSGRLTVGTPPDTMGYELQLGHLDPIDRVSGVQARLNDLGFFCGPPDGTMNESTRAALRAFQEKYQLTVDGNLGQQTKQKLREVYGR
jgi:hypothetical protein